MAKHVLGIDMSLTNTGMVLLRDDHSIRSHTLIQSKLKGYARILEVSDSIIKEVTRTRLTHFFVSMEDYFPGGRGRVSAMEIAKVQGTVICALHKKNIPVLLIHPSRVHSFEANHKQSGAVNTWSEHEEDAWSIANLGMGVFCYGFDNGWSLKLKELIVRMRLEIIKDPFLTFGRLRLPGE